MIEHNFVFRKRKENRSVNMRKAAWGSGITGGIKVASFEAEGEE